MFSKKMNWSNLLTWGRIAAIPLLVVVFWLPPLSAEWRGALSAIIFAAAASTDFLDGYLARRWNQTSRFGAFLGSGRRQIISRQRAGFNFNRRRIHRRPRAFGGGFADNYRTRNLHFRPARMDGDYRGVAGGGGAGHRQMENSGANDGDYYAFIPRESGAFPYFCRRRSADLRRRFNDAVVNAGLSAMRLSASAGRRIRIKKRKRRLVFGDSNSKRV